MRSSAKGLRLAGLALLAALAAVLQPSPLAAQELTVGTIGTTSDAAFYIADKKGFFKDEGLSVKFVEFDSGPKMIPSLGAGHLDVGGGAVSVGLYNAVGRGIGIKIVADKARNPPGYSFEALLVRSELMENGKFRSFQDLKGLRVAITAVGSSEGSLLHKALLKGGLGMRDVNEVFLPFFDHPSAFTNGAIDASISTEPTLTLILRSGAARRFANVDAFETNPNRVTQNAAIFYGADFIKNRPDAARKFAHALVRAFRVYNDAIVDGRLAGPEADEVIAIMTQYSKIKDAGLFREIGSHGVDPDGKVDLPALRNDWNFFKETGQIEYPVTVDDVVDLSFVDAAAAALGPYRRGAKQ